MYTEQSTNYLIDKRVIKGIFNDTLYLYEILDNDSAATILIKELGIKRN